MRNARQLRCFRPGAAVGGRRRGWAGVTGGSWGRRKGLPLPPALPYTHISLCLHWGLLLWLGAALRGGGAGSRSGAATSSPLCFLCCYLFGGGVLGLRLPVAELRSAVDVVPLRPQTSGRLLLCVCRSALSTVVVLLPPLPPPRQLSAGRSEVGGREREGGEGRNLGIYLIRSQQPGPALYSSVVFDSKRGKKRKNSYGGKGGRSIHFSW